MAQLSQNKYSSVQAMPCRAMPCHQTKMTTILMIIHGKKAQDAENSDALYIAVVLREIWLENFLWEKFSCKWSGGGGGGGSSRDADALPLKGLSSQVNMSTEKSYTHFNTYWTFQHSGRASSSEITVFVINGKLTS